MAGFPEPISVLLADASDVARAGVRAILDEHGGFRVAGEAGPHPAHAATHLQPQIVVVDPARDGALDLSVVDDLHAAAPEAGIVLLTGQFDPRGVAAILKGGVHAYLLKGPDLNAWLITATLEGVAREGAVVIGPGVLRLLQSSPDASVSVHAPGAVAKTLTEREREVLVLVAAGQSDKASALQLGIAKSTVEYHTSQLRIRLGVETRAQLIAQACARGLAPEPTPDVVVADA